MELDVDCRLYSDAIAAAKLADERLEPRTRVDYEGSLRRFVQFCEKEGYPNPLQQRFVELPSVLAAHINQLGQTNSSQWLAEKLRAALSWHFSKPEMLTGGHPHDRWYVEVAHDGSRVAYGNPAKSPMIAQILVGLNKVKKRARTPTRASPMSLPKLTNLMNFLHRDPRFNDTMRVWMAAVCSLCFYGMCRINEVLLMKFGDIQLGLQRESTKALGEIIHYGRFTIRDRKTDHDPHASRTYHLHHLPKSEHAASALVYIQRWFEHAEATLHHKWQRDDYAFPSLTKIPRAGIKKRCLNKESDQSHVSFDRVGIKWGAPMSDNNFTQALNIVATACGVSESVLGDRVWFTSYCFRRGGAQYRFMFAPEKRRWSLKMVKWWAGWSQNEQSETIVRYLLDDVLDREENALGDSLAPDMINAINEHQVLPCDNEIGEVATASRTSFASLKEEIVETVRDVLGELLHGHATLNKPSAATAEPAQPQHPQDTSLLMSELPDAKTWRDYVTQYWTSNPALHQYRAGVDMLPHEKRQHRSRLSRMRTIAEFVRQHYSDQLDAFEHDMRVVLGNDLTVNGILGVIRSRRSAAVLETAASR